MSDTRQRTNQQVNKAKSQAQSGLNQAEQQLDELKGKAIQYGKQYPLMTVGLLVLSAFCIGILTTLMINKLSPAFPSDHIEAHRALENVLSQYDGLKTGAAGKVGLAADAIKMAGKAYGAGAIKDKAYDALNSARDSAGNLRDQASDLGLADRLAGLRDDLLGRKEPTLSEKISGGASSLKDSLLEKLPGYHQETLLERAQNALETLKDSLNPQQKATFNDKLVAKLAEIKLLKDSLLDSIPGRHKETLGEKIANKVGEIKDSLLHTREPSTKDKILDGAADLLKKAGDKVHA